MVELRFLLKDLGKYQSEEQLREIMDEMDEGGNGAPLAPHAPARGRDLAVSLFCPGTRPQHPSRVAPAGTIELRELLTYFHRHPLGNGRSREQEGQRSEANALFATLMQTGKQK